LLIQKLLAVAEMGGRYVLYVLVALSVISIGIILERWLYFRSRRIDPRALGRALIAELDQGDLEGARSLLRSQRSVEARVLDDALALYDRGHAAVAEVLANGVREHRGEFEPGLLFLGTLGNNAPFIGLFGTVLGIVTAFRQLGATSAAAMNNVMGSIAEALVATAVGILVALPAVVAYNVFQKKTLDLEENVATIGSRILAHMKGVAPGERG